MARRASRFVGRHGAEGAQHINVTPLIDVVMCLIIFYLIVGRLASGQGRPIDLPSTGVGQTGTPARLVVSVAVPPAGTADPEVSLGGTPVSVAELPAMVRARLGDPARGELAIRADRRLSWGQVRPVVEACRAAGLTSVRLVTEREGGFK
jgi:biopolymer transport protein ExbD